MSLNGIDIEHEYSILEPYPTYDEHLRIISKPRTTGYSVYCHEYDENNNPEITEFNHFIRDPLNDMADRASDIRFISNEAIDIELIGRNTFNLLCGINREMYNPDVEFMYERTFTYVQCRPISKYTSG